MCNPSPSPPSSSTIPVSCVNDHSRRRTFDSWRRMSEQELAKIQTCPGTGSPALRPRFFRRSLEFHRKPTNRLSRIVVDVCVLAPRLVLAVHPLCVLIVHVEQSWTSGVASGCLVFVARCDVCLGSGRVPPFTVY